MPTISMFLGIVIRMNWLEHNPPHFHAEYQGHRAVFDLDGNLTHGEMPVKQSKLISAWAVLHADELRANWELRAGGRNFTALTPFDNMKVLKGGPSCISTLHRSSPITISP